MVNGTVAIVFSRKTNDLGGTSSKLYLSELPPRPKSRNQILPKCPLINFDFKTIILYLKLGNFHI